MSNSWELLPANWVIVDMQPIEGMVHQNHPHVYKKYPGILGRLPLFLPCNERVNIKEPLISRWGIVRFQRRCLNITDEELFISLVNCSGVFKGSIVDLCRLTGLTSKQSVSRSIESLHNNPIEIQIDYKGISFNFSGSLIKASGDEDNLILELHEKLICEDDEAEAKQHYRTLAMDVREELSLTGKALHRFITSHRFEQPYSIEIVREAIAPLQRIDNFKREILTQLKVMKSHGFLKSFELVRDKLRYERNPTEFRSEKHENRRVKVKNRSEKPENRRKFAS